MHRKNKRVRIVIVAAIVAIVLAGVVIFLTNARPSPKPMPVLSEMPVVNADSIKEAPPQPTEAYKGESVSVSSVFTIKVPGGWKASVSTSANFLAIMFARPNQLESLVYDPNLPPVVDLGGIPSWNGLTEHFYIIVPTPSRQFNSANHLEVSSEPFTFDDGTVGEKYYVVKHAEEAQKWGGLQKDTEWQGRTYIYEKDGKRVEAHLALYPSTPINIDFYESIIRTLRVVSN